ncbi:hypothetical protein C1886_20315 [Pseudomonas sp. FW300-N1A1]|nr:hypothetical protein C1886_20315 [Pseudomonas sp. FW300-N1A1]
MRGCRTPAPWRGSLLALGCTAAPKPDTKVFLTDHNCLLRAATQPSGSKLPRHRGRVHAGVECVLRSEDVDGHRKTRDTGPVASELARAGLHSSPKTGHQGLSDRPQLPSQGRYAAQREQAPSPQRPRSRWSGMRTAKRGCRRSSQNPGYRTRGEGACSRWAAQQPQDRSPRSF